jgi:hypothetical protein
MVRPVRALGVQEKIEHVQELEGELSKVRTGLKDAWAAHADAVRGLSSAQAAHVLEVQALQDRLHAAHLAQVSSTTARMLQGKRPSSRSPHTPHPSRARQQLTLADMYICLRVDVELVVCALWSDVSVCACGRVRVRACGRDGGGALSACFPRPPSPLRPRALSCERLPRQASWCLPFGPSVRGFGGNWKTPPRTWKACCGVQVQN